MKSLIYSALIGSLALAFTAQAAKDKPKKESPDHAEVEKAAKAPKKHGKPHATKVQQQAINPGQSNAAAVHHAKKQNYNAAVARQNQANAAAMQRNNAMVQPQTAQFQRTQIAAANAQQNMAVQQAVAANRVANQTRQVAIVNNWQGSNYSGADYAAFRNYRRQVRSRSWYHSNYPRIAVSWGGNYYWNNGYWYPAWGYNSGYHYGYDGPIYGYNNYTPEQVVINVQRRLRRAGYYHGAIDGSIGPITRRAIAAFQADRGLAITSTIDRPTLSTMGLI